MSKSSPLSIDIYAHWAGLATPLDVPSGTRIR
jgi:hypothetical protein